MDESPTSAFGGGEQTPWSDPRTVRSAPPLDCAVCGQICGVGPDQVPYGLADFPDNAGRTVLCARCWSRWQRHPRPALTLSGLLAARQVAP